jgi:AraC family transcriptional regulator of adaptative response/methylated-DNA-[protein]-cysteine methyltransferase
VVTSGRGVCAISIGDDRETLIRDLHDQFPRTELVEGDGAVGATVAAFVDDPARGLALPLDAQGTAFQQRVWRAVREIPVGATASYTDVADRIGAPHAVRAVARACASNALAVAIPCHRVVARDGALTGYRWGVARKRALLDREAGA